MPTPSPLELLVMAEKADALGFAGTRLERSLAALAGCIDPAAREPLVQAAAEAAHHYLIQRELCGLLDPARAIADFGIPPEVVVRIGAAPRKG